MKVKSLLHLSSRCARNTLLEACWEVPKQNIVNSVQRDFSNGSVCACNHASQSEN